MVLKDSGIRDNHNYGSVGEFLEEAISEGSDFDTVSAYFTIYAYECLQEQLDTINHLKFLFGEPTYLNQINPNSAKMEFSITDNAIQLPIEKRLQQKKLARDCAEWIESKVDIRSMIKPNFLHGKMYHITNPSGLEKAIVGSSNFTKNGLGYGNIPNIELNLILKDNRDIKDLKNWFDEVWESELSEDKKDFILQILKRIYAENSPEFIYYKTLYHLFEVFLEEESKDYLLDERTGFFDSAIWNSLYDFQREGSRAAINKILKYNGCIIADSVGLGKTYEALAVIKYFELKNENVLVLCPKKLRQNWTIYKENYDINPFLKDRFSYTVLSHTDLTRKSGSVGDTDLSRINWGNYGLVVIDESHNFRNSGQDRQTSDDHIVQNRYSALMQNVIKSGVQTKVLMLSATPVNNYLRDIRNQIYLITSDNDDALNDFVGISSISNTIKIAQTQFTDWAKQKHHGKNVTTKDLLEKLDSGFFKLLDTLTIARSRKHITAFYNLKEIGSFPTRNKPINIYPDIDLADEFPSYDVLNKQISQYHLSIFKPSEYLKKEYADADLQVMQRGEFNQRKREALLVGMMKVNYLKRLESSVNSFEISLSRTIQKIDSLENKIHKFQEAFEGYNQLEIEELINEAELETDDDMETTVLDWKTGKKFEYSLNHLELNRWLEDLDNDKNQLIEIQQTAKKITPDRDYKLQELKRLIKIKVESPFNKLVSIATEAELYIPNKKVLIFTAYADTAIYLYENLYDLVVNEMQLHIAIVTGGNRSNKTSYPPGKHSFLRQTDFDRILSNFSPRSKNRNLMRGMPQEGEIDILIATDCISEGQNLQDCDYMINYDIHWNPVRIIQRFGRIDRIGSTNNTIQMVNFWPTKDLDQYINLKDRVEARMALVDLTATADDNLLETDQLKDLITEELRYREKQLKKMKDEVLDLEDMEDQISLTDFSLDDFRRDLANFLKENEKLLKEAPLGMYSLVPCNHTNEIQTDLFEQSVSDIIQPGIIFCLRHSKDSRSSLAVNPLHPYYLVYIYKNGSVRFNYTSAKKILEIYRALCRGKNEIYQELCDAFNEKTKQGSDMQEYSELLIKAIDRIKAVFSHRNQNQLFKRGGRLVSSEQQINSVNEFELITWLIINEE